MSHSHMTSLAPPTFVAEGHSDLPDVILYQPTQTRRLHSIAQEASDGGAESSPDHGPHRGVRHVGADLLLLLAVSGALELREDLLRSRPDLRYNHLLLGQQAELKL